MNEHDISIAADNNEAHDGTFWIKCCQVFGKEITHLVHHGTSCLLIIGAARLIHGMSSGLPADIREIVHLVDKCFVGIGLCILGLTAVGIAFSVLAKTVKRCYREFVKDDRHKVLVEASGDNKDKPIDEMLDKEFAVTQGNSPHTTTVQPEK